MKSARTVAVVVVFVLLLQAMITTIIADSSQIYQNCSQLYRTQYKCQYPSLSKRTFEYKNCPPNGTLLVRCYPILGVNCTIDGDSFEVFDDEQATTDEALSTLVNTNIYFLKPISCVYTNGAKFFVALGLSIFLGICGVDRCYLGYWGLGVFKLFTIGGFGVWWMIDLMLISMQFLGPNDGSSYVVGYNGPRTSAMYRTNETLVVNFG